MRKRIIRICTVIILVCAIYGCVRTSEYTFVSETETMEREYIETEDEEETGGEDKGESKNDEPVTVIAKVSHYFVDESDTYWAEYEYDDAGNQIKITNYNYDGSIEYWDEWEYDSERNLTKTVKYSSDGDIIEWSEFTYDSMGNQVQHISYDVDGNVVVWYEYEYDSEGNMTEEINCSDNGSTYFRTEYEYDSEGNLAKMIEYYLSHRVEYEYITIPTQTAENSRLEESVDDSVQMQEAVSVKHKQECICLKENLIPHFHAKLVRKWCGNIKKEFQHRKSIL